MNTSKLSSTFALTLSLFGLAACDDDRMPYCEETVTVLDSLDAQTPAGISAGELLAKIEGEQLLRLDYVPASANEAVQVETSHHDAGSTELMIALEHAGGELRWIEAEERTPPGRGPVPAIAISCPDRIELDAELSFETEDGAFAELFEVVVSASVDEWGEWGEAGEFNLARITQALVPSALEGALEILSITPGDPTRVDYSLNLDYPLTQAAAGEAGAVGVPTGGVGGGAEYQMGKGKDGVVMYGMFELARLALAAGGPAEGE